MSGHSDVGDNAFVCLCILTHYLKIELGAALPVSKYVGARFSSLPPPNVVHLEACFEMSKTGLLEIHVLLQKFPKDVILTSCWGFLELSVCESVKG